VAKTKLKSTLQSYFQSIQFLNFSFELMFSTGYSTTPYQLTPWSRVLVEKLIVAQLPKMFPLFMQPEYSLPCSKETATGTYCNGFDQLVTWQRAFARREPHRKRRSYIAA
jgi:hypothetical protein